MKFKILISSSTFNFMKDDQFELEKRNITFQIFMSINITMVFEKKN